MSTPLQLAAKAILDGTAVPVLGPGVLAAVRHKGTDEPIPAESEALILGLNQGRPLSPRLMYEFSRAAMHVENKRGRKAIERYLVETYDQDDWSTGAVHAWLGQHNLDYVIDLNRDKLLLDTYADRRHLLVVGVARISGTDYRFKIFEWVEGSYQPRDVDTVDGSLPVLFKPLGAPKPEANFIASDADFVDYITELMGGFAVPSFIKSRRLGKKYVLVGLRLTRDTERMVLTEIMYGADDAAGYAVIAEPTEKELAWCEKRGLEVIDASVDAVVEALGSCLPPLKHTA